MDIDKYLERIGYFGRYQTTLLIILPILQGVFPSWQVLSSVFILYEPPHRCKTDAAANVSIPIGEDGKPSKCSMYKYDEDTIYQNETTYCENGWVYDDSKKVVSLVTELDLVCDQAILSPNAVSIFFCGVLFGSVINGQLSDMYGRKFVSWMGLIGVIVTGVIITFVHNYIAFVIIWFVVAMCIMATMTCTFILLLELFPPKQRAIACCISTIAWGIGLCLVTPIAYWFQNWRHFQLAITLPMILFLPLWWFVVESPRWLHTKGRHSDVRKIIEKMGKFNGVDCAFLDESASNGQKSLLVLDQTAPEDTFNDKSKSHRKTYSLFDTLRTPNLRKYTIIMFFMWLVNSLVYYGLALNSSSLAGDRFLNFFILGLAEVPAYVFGLWALQRYGRRRLLLCFHVIASVACILTIAIPPKSGDGKNLSVLITTSAFIGKLSITLTYTIVWIFSSEIFPTVIRTIGIGECSMMARIGGICAPYVMYTGKSVTWIPMVLFAVLSLCAGIAVLVLPESFNRPLPETIEDGENFKDVKPVTAAYSRAPNEDDYGDNETSKV
ncbi:organic cation transporter protein-like [Anneissia japonica]|uniref:organic cation transporter protein-like n=1 Tax=Anneissia japonica TaxID=1529436 RepID=UPI001425B81F|nr:organic cation transporter protein-like [Anneissia japonica]XP_033105735.1 organic cation transporter protein-like [Anneissia japonica]XP_033105736.1 organic cation transporter protein-like [Anneissia japonica]XP_033105737.1 organic cation transporter protein-like [Anneissia japonica]